MIYGLGAMEDKKIISGGNDSKINFYIADGEEDDNNYEENKDSQDENYNRNEFYNEGNNDDEDYESLK